MRSVSWLCSCALVLALCGVPCVLSGANYQKGVSYVSYGSAEFAFNSSASAESLTAFRAIGGEWITLVFSWYQPNINSTTIGPAADYSEDDIAGGIALAHSLGLRVTLKPHVDLSDDPAHWRGQIGTYFTADQWDAWFSSYDEFIVHFARKAQEWGCEQMVIGTELSVTSHHQQEWRDIIALIRQEFNGPLTFAANWYVRCLRCAACLQAEQSLPSPRAPSSTAEPAGCALLCRCCCCAAVACCRDTIALEWWDALDAIGVDAYFPLTTEDDPTPSELAAAWGRWLPVLSNLSAVFGDKPVILTELGYCSAIGSNKAPYACENVHIDLNEQADDYAAVFANVVPQSWLHGLYWWAWDTNPNDGGDTDTGFTPQRKPAQQILQQNYQQTTDH
jgi:hypothetical protein